MARKQLGTAPSNAADAATKDYSDNAVQTLTNKTLTTPQINQPTTTGQVIQDTQSYIFNASPPSTSIGAVTQYAKSDNHIYSIGSDSVERQMVDVSATQTLTNKTLTSPTLNTPTLNTAVLNGYAPSIVLKSGAYTLTSTDSTVLTDSSGGTFSVTLPSAIGLAGIVYLIQKIDATTITTTIATTSSQTINGVTTYALTVPNAFVQVISDGSNWRIIDQSSEAILNDMVFGPAEQGYKATTGDILNFPSAIQLQAGTVYLFCVNFKSSQTISTLSYVIQTSGANMTGSQCIASMFNFSGVKVGSNATSITTTAGNNTASIGSTTIPAGKYWVSLLFNGTPTPTAPKLQGNTALGPFLNVGLTASTARFGTWLTGQTTMPASITPSSIVITGSIQLPIWIGVS